MSLTPTESTTLYSKVFAVAVSLLLVTTTMAGAAAASPTSQSVDAAGADSGDMVETSQTTPPGCFYGAMSSAIEFMSPTDCGISA